mmetsp:Transcript_14573/g.14036  ORF Transcript_14573/g.14036 Transcript_14573/m.14036 type:complete len:135 (+) Transcript_14573:163-567(+)
MIPIALCALLFYTTVVAFVHKPYFPTNCRFIISSRKVTSTIGLAALSKKAEMYIKVKRLKQIIADGKDYQDYVEEQRRYEKPTGEEQLVEESSNSTSTSVDVKRKLMSMDLKDSDPVEVMRKVPEIQQKKVVQV